MDGAESNMRCKGGIVDRTKSWITPDEPEEQIRNSRAFKPWSYATICDHSIWLDRVPHGDMVIPIWHRMAKTAQFGQSGPHSCFHISMATARILSTKDAIDTWDSGPNMCHLPSLMVASSYFYHWRESDTRMGQNGNMPQLG